MSQPLKLDLGAGPNRIPSFTGVDRIAFPGVDVVCDLTERMKVDFVSPPRFKEWPWENESVSEIHSSHVVEHLEPAERIHFVNECHRILVPKGTATIITPHWCSQRAYGDLTHKWPAVSEFWFHYLGREWRMANAPHTDREHWSEGYTCDFDAVCTEIMNYNYPVRDKMAQEFAKAYYKDAIDDLRTVLYKR